MKNLLFGLMATVIFSFTGNAQTKLTKESVRLSLAKGMVSFTNSLKPAFNNSKNYGEFKTAVCGKWTSKITKEGENLLTASYNLIASKKTDQQILDTYNGKEMAAASLSLIELRKKDPKADGAPIFGGTTGDFNPYGNQTLARCRWFQIGCWIDEIFGPGTTKALVDELIPILVSLLL